MIVQLGKGLVVYPSLLPLLFRTRATQAYCILMTKFYSVAEGSILNYRFTGILIQEHSTKNYISDRSLRGGRSGKGILARP